jgi:hypothetical protein
MPVPEVGAVPGNLGFRVLRQGRDEDVEFAMERVV